MELNATINFFALLAHIKGRRHKKRVASRRKNEDDLISTLTVYAKRLHKEQTPTDDTTLVSAAATVDFENKN